LLAAHVPVQEPSGFTLGPEVVVHAGLHAPLSRTLQLLVGLEGEGALVIVDDTTQVRLRAGLRVGLGWEL
jgi:hypothetical protein